MSYVGPYDDTSKPVRAWQVLEQAYVGHRKAADNARDEVRSLKTRIESVEEDVRYQENAAEECLSAAAELRRLAGEPQLDDD